MAKLKFKETQRYRHWEVITLLAILSLGTAIRLLYSALSESPAGNDGLLLGLFLLASLIFALVYLVRVRMKIKIDEKGIKYSISPWQWVRQKIRWEEVARAEIVDLPEPAALSGWAVQYSSRTLGWNMGYHRGLRLDLRNGETYFLGIDDLDELQEILGRILAGRGR